MLTSTRLSRNTQVEYGVGLSDTYDPVKIASDSKVDRHGTDSIYITSPWRPCMTHTPAPFFMVPPPLLGDADGKYRVHIVGNSGAGKSTVGERLANVLGVPFIPLDTLFWKPGWEKSSSEEMRPKVAEALANAPNGWVVDGDYIRRIGSLVTDVETDVIWLDPPLALYLPRLIWRTFSRLLHLAPPCSPGCPERPMKVFFSKESIIWWCLSQHWFVRKREGQKMQRIGIGMGTDVSRRRMRRIGGWGGELRAWFVAVEKMLQGE